MLIDSTVQEGGRGMAGLIDAGTSNDRGNLVEPGTWQPLLKEKKHE